MRVVFAALVLAAASTGLRADDKIDPKQLLGKWELVPGKGKGDDAGITMEYLADGKVKGEFRLAGMTDKMEGTYKIDGNKVRLTTKDKGRENTSVITVISLSDTEMVVSEDGQPKQTYRRVKDK
jgi:uncharacterized protein (TIGR03066 family)